MTARCSQIGEIVCFPWGAENFTTICVSNCVCRSSAKDYSGVRHFRESTDRTGVEPEPSAPLSEKNSFFFEKNAKIIEHLQKKSEYTIWKCTGDSGGKRHISRKKFVKFLKKVGTLRDFLRMYGAAARRRQNFPEKSEFLLSACQKKLNKGVGRSFAVWSSAAKLTRMTHRARAGGRGPCCQCGRKICFFHERAFLQR